jgi:glycine/D-amino acid oxidase-like deaminating enzyme
MPERTLHVGIVGAGIGGVLCAIAIARAGGNVTILEAAQQLGEIGAGIQMVRQAHASSSARHSPPNRRRMFQGSLYVMESTKPLAATSYNFAS